MATLEPVRDGHSVTWTVERWSDVRGLEHGFGGRVGPVPADVVTLRQVHGTTVLDVRDVVDKPPGDGLVTGSAEHMVGVWTADCVPVLLVAPTARVAAAVHSGWRGSAAGVVEAAIALLESRWDVRSCEVAAALGPAIGGCCYEVGEDVRDALFVRAGGLAMRCFDERGGTLRLDLRRFLEGRLRELGVTDVEIVGPCTACRSDVLHSYRKEKSAGRQLSWIGFRE
ncbi:MAG: purine-nucleoside/S-methyl-5-thioadenosine phosphorylase / adenosine deaminase [Candidatus Binatota bacterium]|nr:purine-nucleoside/S-methyl-5-thioadenosine phosphorylase / adenosine deaminase [Candidatus Binatota bacterium]